MRNLILVLLLLLTFNFGFSQMFDVDTIQFNGSTDTLINIVILGDGYTQNLLDKFVEDAHSTSRALFKDAPYSNYRNYFNVFLIKVPSNESGAANDPTYPIDNYYGSTYNAYGMQRLLVPMKESKISGVLAANLPSYDIVIMIVNDTRYGGSGGWVSTSSMHADASEIMLHEMGHSFAGLIDEYWAGEQYAHEGINMTQETNIELLKWKNWHGSQGVGLYPHSESPVWYRPHQNCKMRYLGADFCAVCKEGIIEKIHSLVSPLVSYIPASTSLTSSDYPISFKLNMLKPLPNTLNIKWILNNLPFDTNTDSVKVHSFDLLPGINNLSAIVEDTTRLLRVDKHNQIHLSAVIWNIEKSTSRIKTLFSKKMNITIFPNPFQNYLTIKSEQEIVEDIKIEIVDIKGTILVSNTFRSQKQISLSTSNLSQGYYILKLYADNVLIATHNIVKN